MLARGRKLALLFVAASLCFGETLVDFTQPGATTSSSDYVVGYSFRALGDLWVTQIGAFDTVGVTGQPDGFAGPQRVGLWTESGALLATTVINPDAVLQGFFRYSSIVPVLLNEGSVYVIGTQGANLPGGEPGEGYTTEPRDFVTGR